MSTVIKKWKDLTGLENEDWYYYKIEEARKNNPLDDDYVCEKYRTNKDGYPIFVECAVDKND